MNGPGIPTDMIRYARQMVLPEVGAAGQQRLAESSILVVGLGALGGAAAAYLVAAGVGRVTLIDGDTVDTTNLHRQILHGDSWVGRSKIDSALSRLHETNPLVRLEGHPEFLRAGNAREIVAGHDIIIDGSDNFPTRFLCNDIGFFLGIPVVHASILRFQGQLSVFAPHLGGPCYRCLFPSLPDPASVPSCAEAGVFGALAGMLGSLQAMEAIKLMLGAGQGPAGRLIHYDALRVEWREISLPRDPACPLCGESPRIVTLRDETSDCPDACPVAEISAATLAKRLAGGWGGILLDVREPWEQPMGVIPGSLPATLARLDNMLDRLRLDPHLHEGIIVYCESGRRSLLAARQLAAAGLPVIGHLSGGHAAWRSIHQAET